MIAQIRKKDEQHPFHLPDRRDLIRALPWLVLLVSLAGTYLLWDFARRDSLRELRSYFDYRVRDVNSRIRGRMLDYEQVLRGAQGLFLASKTVDRAGFHDYVASLRLQDNFSGHQALEYSLIVPPSDLDKHIASLRRGGFPDYSISSESRRDFSTSIVYVEPFVDSNIPLLGKDMFAEPALREAMERARDLGALTLSGKVALAQDSSGDMQAGFLMVLPVYRASSIPGSVSGRQAGIVGWVCSPFRMNDVMRDIFGERASDLDIEIYDGAEVSQQTLMYDADSADLNGTVRRFQETNLLELGGRTWSVVIKSMPALDARLNSAKPQLIVVACLIASLLLGLLTHLIVRLGTRVLKIADDRDERYQQLMQQANDIIILSDLTGRILEVNERAVDQFGYSIKEMRKMSVRDLFQPEVMHDAAAYVRKVKSDGEARIETFNRRKNGMVFPVEISARVVVFEGKEYILGFGRDITDRRAAEAELNQLRKAVSASGEIIFLVNREGTFTYINPEFTRIYGYEEAEVLGKVTPRILKSGTMGEENYRTFWSTILSKKNAKGEMVNRTKDGRLLTIESSVNPVLDDSGAIAGFLAIQRDVTERKQAVEQLEMLKHSIDHHYDAAFWMDRDNRFVYVNETSCRGLQYESDELLNKHVSLVNPAASEERLDLVWDTLRTKHFFTVESTHRRKDGSEFPVEIVSSYVKFGDKEYNCGFARDVTERKRAEKLQQAVYRIAQADEEAGSVGRLLQMVHEIIRTIMPADNFYLSLYHEAHDLLSFPYFVDQHDGAPAPRRPGKGLTEYVLRTGKPLLCNAAVMKDLIDRGEIEIMGTPTSVWLGAPLIFEGKSFGVMVAQDYSNPDAYGEAELKMIEYVSVQVAKAVERKKAAEEIASAMAYAQTIIDSAPVGMITYNASGSVVTANEAIAKIAGTNLEQVRKQNYRSIEPWKSNGILRAIETALAMGRPQSGEFSGLSTFGKKLTISAYFVPIRLKDEPQVLMVAEDITERKRVEEALRESQEKYRFVVENLHEVIFQTDAAGHWMFLNSAWTEVTGFDVSTSLGCVFLEFVHPDDRQRNLELFQPLIERKKDYCRHEIRYLHKDGGYRWIEVWARLTLDAQGNSTGTAGTLTDITERRLAEEALNQSRERYRLLYDHAPVGILLANRSGEILEVNPASLQILGSPSAEITKTINLLTFPALVEAGISAAYRRCLETGEAGYGEFPYVTRWGRSVHTLLRCVPIPDAEGEVTLALIIIEDVTERKRAEDNRLELERQLLHSQKLESLGVLAGGIAHDFNNLLTAIGGNLDLALRRSPANPSRTNIERALQATYRAGDLTREMLAYSGKGKFLVSRLDLNAIVGENGELFRTAVSKTVTLNMPLAAELPSIEADPAQIQQVIMNLITNASEAIGERTGVITLKTGVVVCNEHDLSKSRLEEKPQAGKFVYLEVKDTGRGMTEEVRNRLFDPFFTTKFTGRGLGMSAVLGIVRGHKGAIFVESEPDQGTTIRVLFPVGVSEPTESNDAPVQPEPSLETFSVSGIVLVVDDEEYVRDLGRELIEEFGLQCLCAADGEEAVSIFREHSREIVCVLLDLTMPKKNGLETFAELRRIDPGVRVILSSGFDEQEVTQRFAGEGLSGFVQKPYRIAELREKLMTVLF